MKTFIDYLKDYGIYGMGVLVVILIAGVAIFGEKSPKQLTRSEQVQQIFMLDGSSYELKRAVKKNMNDPDSFEHVETKYVDQGSGDVQVFMTFRGKNTFGGKVMNRAVASIEPKTLKINNLVIEN